MAQYNSSFNNLVNTVQPMTGEQTIHVDQIDFDTSCPCQITACDGGTIKFCAPVSFDPPPEYKGNICDFNSNAYLQGFVAKESFGYSLCKDTATCGPPLDDGVENKALIGLPDPVSGFISTILQTESPGMTGTSAKVKIFAPDAKTTITGGKCIDIVGGSGNNVDVNLQTGDPQGRLSVVSSRDMTLNCIGGNTPSNEGNFKIEASYGKIDILATGLDPTSYTRSQDIDITAQRGSIVLTPEPYNFTPGRGANEGYTVMNKPQIAGFNIQQQPTNTGQSEAGQLRIYQEPSPSNVVWWYVSVIDHVGGTVKWYKTQMTPA